MSDPDNAIGGGCAVGWEVKWHSEATSEGLAGGIVSRCLLHALVLNNAVSGAGSMSGLPACSSRFAAGSHPGPRLVTGCFWQCCCNSVVRCCIFSIKLWIGACSRPQVTYQWQAAIDMVLHTAKERQAAQVTGLGQACLDPQGHHP